MFNILINPSSALVKISRDSLEEHAGEERAGKRAGGLALLFAGALALSGCGEKNTPDAHYQRANAALTAGDTRTAEIELKSALELDSSFVEARWALGQLYFKVGNAPAALKEFDAAASLGMQSEELKIARIRALLLAEENEAVADELGKQTDLSATRLALLAFAQIKLGDLDAAEATAQSAIDSAPDNADAFTAMAEIALRREDYEKAIATADAALAANPGFPVALWAKGIALEKSRKLAEAAEIYRKLTTVSGQEDNGKLSLIRMLLAQQKVDEAEQILKSVKTSGQAHFLRAGVAVARDKTEDAKRELQLSLKLQPNNPNTLLVMAMLNHRQGEVNQAVDGYKRLLALIPHHGVARRGLASILVSERDLAGAISVLERGMRFHNQSASYVASLSGLLLATKNVERAEQLLRNLPDGETDNQRLTKEGLLGELLARIGETDKALEVFEEQARDYDVPGPLVRIVQTHLSLRQFSQALDRAKELVERSPNQPQNHWLLGTVYQRLDRRDEAKAAFTQALELDPEHTPSLERLAREQLIDDPTVGRASLEKIASARKPGWTSAELNLARLDLAENKRAEAMARLDALIDAEPNEPRAYIEKAKLTAGDENLKEAIALLETAQKTAPSYAPVYPMLARYYYFDEQHERAIETGRTALDAFPGDPLVLRIIARAHWARGQRTEAMDAYRTLVHQYPKAPRPKIEFASLLRSEGDHARAMEQVQAALKLEPRNASAAFELAQIHLAGREYAKSERIIDLLLANEQAPEVLDVAGELAAAKREYGKAAEHFAAALELAPTSERANSVLIARANNDAMDEAFQGAEQWLTEHPDDQLVRFTRAQLFLAAERTADARADYDKILKVNPDHVGALNNLAWMLQENELEAAARTAARAYELAPNNGAVADTYAWILAEKNELQQAQSILAKLMLSNNVPPAAIYHLAVVEGKLGRLDKASELLDKVLASDTPFKERAAAQQLRSRL